MATAIERAIARSGHEDRELCIDIATGLKDDKTIIRQYCLTSAAMLKRFTERHADYIAAIGAAIQKGDQPAMHGLWSALKGMRVAEMERDVKGINSVIGYYSDEDGNIDVIFGTNRVYTNLLQVKAMLLRAIADEIDGPRRSREVTDEDRKQVRSMVEGISTEDLWEGLT